MKIKLNKHDLYRLIENFWFAPNDALLRSVEVSIWKNIKFKKPVMEIGVGDGIMDKFLFKNKIIDVGIDIDAKGIINAKNNSLYKKVVFMSAANMNIHNSTFNTIIANSTFEHIKYDLKAISEVSRVLKKNGKFIFCVPTDRFAGLLSQNSKDESEILSYNKRVSQFHYRSLKEWTKILKTNGLKIVDYKYYFPENVFKMWYKLHKLVVLKPYKRELWSYLKDSPLRKFIPETVVIKLLKILLLPYYYSIVSDDGVWIFIISQKT